MKHPGLALKEPLDDDYVSDFSVSVVDDNIASPDNASAIEKAVMFLKGTLKAKEEEMTRLREEKEALIESKLELMMQVKQAKLEEFEMGRKLREAEKEKEFAAMESKMALLEMENSSKTELVEMAKVLSQAQKEKEAALESKIDLLVELTEKAEIEKTLLRKEKEKEKAFQQVNLKTELVEMAKLLSQAQKEIEGLIESKLNLLMEELKVLQNELTEKAAIKKILPRIEKEKKDAMEQVELGKKHIAELTRNLAQEQKEKREALNQGKQLKEKHVEEIGFLKARIAELEKVKDPPKKSREPIYYDWTKEKELLNNLIREQNQKVEAANQEKQLKEKHAAEIELSKARIAELEKVQDPPKKSIDSGSIWQSSGTKVAVASHGYDVDALRCPPLKAGTFEWKIQVNEKYSWMRLGVISSSTYFPTHWIGSCKKTWGYKYNGSAMHDGKEVSNCNPKFKYGSVVHFVLDLTGNGILSVSVDGSRLVQIFSNMKSSHGKDKGFLPAVSLSTGARIELLDFKGQ